MNVIYQKSDGTIKDFIEGEVNGLNSELAIAEITGSYSGNETNISELNIENIPTEISKLTIVDRLISAGKLSDAMTALESDTTAKARWEAAVSININDPDVITLLNSISVDPETILY
jgi:hypothetical protein